MSITRTHGTDGNYHLEHGTFTFYLLTNSLLHPEHTPLALLFNACVLTAACHLQSHAQHSSGMLGGNDAIIPQSGRAKCCFALVLDACFQCWVCLLTYCLHD